MTDENLQLYKEWAPDTAMWTQWAKPVLFMTFPHQRRVRSLEAYKQERIHWTSYKNEQLLIVDLPDDESIIEGLALARLGYRPVPLFNGVYGSKSVVPMLDLINGLRCGGPILAQMNLSDKANPAFLLDANRLKGAKKKRGTFDNRWCIVPQDMPSADYLKAHGIKEIIVRTEELQKDLQHILYQYQKQGISIYRCNKKGTIELVNIPKSNKIGLFYRFLLMFGFARNASGGFGMSIPEASSGGGGYRAG